MSISLFSFISAIMWGSILIVIIYVMRRQKFFIKHFNASTIITLYAFGAFRIFVPLEFPFTFIIPSYTIYPPVREVLFRPTQIGKFQYPLYNILAVVVMAISCVLIILNMLKYILAMRRLRSVIEQTHKHQYILDEINHKQYTIRLVKCKSISSPLSLGIFIKYIFLPDVEYSEEELYYILLHEYTHLANGDLLIKLLSMLYCYLFWWNPVTYLLVKDLEQTLELKCDLSMAERLSLLEKKTYLLTLIKELNRSREQTCKLSYLDRMWFSSGSKAQKHIIERFQLMLHYGTHKKKQNRILVLPILVLIVALLSYSFILQPEYRMSVGQYEGLIDDKDIMIYKNKNEEYIMETPEGRVVINKNIAEMYMDQGVSVTEE